jgi:hypothetical protein
MEKILVKMQRTPSLPVIKINMYTEDSDEDNDDFDSSSECQQLVPRKVKMSHNLEDELESQLQEEEIDEAGLKMFCLDRISLIKEDLRDPSLTTGERLINLTNLTTLNTLLSNIRLVEKSKLGALRDSQITDAVILQKQVVCNLARQKEYSDIIRPVIVSQPQFSDFKPIEANTMTSNSEMTGIKSILKPNNAKKNNSLDYQVPAV